MLICPDYSKQFILQTDVSERGVGAVLSQSQVDGTDKPIALYSREVRPNQLIFLFLIIKKIKFNEGMLYKNNQIM